MEHLSTFEGLGLPTITLASAGIIGAAALAGKMGLFGGNRMPVDGRTVLLTGASEGLGRSAAIQLSQKGASIILVARNVSKLEDALADVKAAAKSPHTQRFHFISADVSEAGYAVRIVREATAWNGGRAPDVVWCVAGMSTPMLWADSDDAVAKCRRNMDVNFWGAAEMSHAILRAWYGYDSGDDNDGDAASSIPKPSDGETRHLIFTCSVLAFYSIAGYGPYNPTKCAVRGLADTICQETLLYTEHPVRIHLVTPGTILSPGFEREQQTKPDITLQLEKDDPQQTPDQVATIAIRGLESGHYIITTNLFGHLMRWGALGGSLRNNWLVDILGAWLISLAYFFVLWVMRGDISAWGKKHGHPRTYPKKELKL